MAYAILGQGIVDPKLQLRHFVNMVSGDISHPVSLLEFAG